MLETLALLAALAPTTQQVAPAAEALARLRSLTVEVKAGTAVGHTGKSGWPGDPHEVLAARSWAMVHELLLATLAANRLPLGESGSYPRMIFQVDAVQAAGTVALCSRLEVWDLVAPRPAQELSIPALIWRAEAECASVPSNFGTREAFALAAVKAQIVEFQRARHSATGSPAP